MCVLTPVGAALRRDWHPASSLNIKVPFFYYFLIRCCNFSGVESLPIWPGGVGARFGGAGIKFIECESHACGDHWGFSAVAGHVCDQSMLDGHSCTLGRNQNRCHPPPPTKLAPEAVALPSLYVGVLFSEPPWPRPMRPLPPVTPLLSPSDPPHRSPPSTQGV